MKLVFLTIVLDGMPYIAGHLQVFNRLSVDWEWHIVEGAAMPAHCTSWCKSIEPRLSRDGTTEYLAEISRHPRVKVYQRESWAGKIAMVNEPLHHIAEPCVLVQIDSDEMWTAGQLELIRQMFVQHPEKNAALFTCRYFVGQHIAVTARGGYGNKDGEWLRAFRYLPGMRFERHEPPQLAGVRINAFSPEETEVMGLVFDHYAYATRKQVEFKERYYGYTGAAAAWDKLQENTQWPARLGDFLPWVTGGSVVNVVK